MDSECRTYPCVRIGVDHRSKKFAVFIETAEGDFFYIETDKILEACRKIEELKHKHYSEAYGGEIDDIAYNILGLLPVEEE